MNIIQRIRKHLAIRSYLKKLPRLLASDYGRSKTYTPRQIRSTIERSGLNVDYSCYGVAMFSGREAFDQYHSEIGENCNFDTMRMEVAHSHFEGNSNFTMSEITGALSEHPAEYGDSNHTGSSDGHSSH